MSLPAWAEALVPVDMDGAAACLGIGRRTLVDVIRVHQHYERRGSKKVFYPEHIRALQLHLADAPATKREALKRGMLAHYKPSQIADFEAFFERETEGRVYFIRCNDRVKIGFATDFSQRMRVLRTACPHPVEVLANLSGDRQLEIYLHRCFSPYRRHGEWFEETGALAEIIQAMAKVPE